METDKKEYIKSLKIKFNKDSIKAEIFFYDTKNIEQHYFNEFKTSESIIPILNDLYTAMKEIRERN